MVGIAYRSLGTPSLYLLGTLRYKDDLHGSSATDDRTRSEVLSVEMTYKADPKLTIFAKYAGKYSQDDVSSQGFSSYTDLMLAGVRYDLTDRWDVEVVAKLMNQYDVDMHSLGLEVKTGFRVYRNLYLDLGYNMAKMDDRDLSGASYKSGGFFFGMRFKFDEDTLGLR